MLDAEAIDLTLVTPRASDHNLDDLLADAESGSLFRPRLRLIREPEG